VITQFHLNFPLTKEIRNKYYKCIAAIIVVVVIVWYLDLQLLMQSGPITTNVVSLNPAHGGQLYKPLSNDELHQLRETENLFHSSVFKLQVMCDSIIGIIV
jgi:hypothetical protein